MIEMQPAELRRVRKQMRLSQTQLADALGLHYQSIGRMENGSLTIEPRTAMAVMWMAEHLNGAGPAVVRVPYFESLADFDTWLKTQNEADA